ncbi:MAG TPA: DUF3347 domain-containing protein [Vicinamibacterales bacterium]|nr:DUF3347 domain-containing protein [Vicinamibacterales bacterium]
MRACIIAAALALVAIAPPAAAQEPGAVRRAGQDPAAYIIPAQRAFEHYEGVRAALAADSLADTTPHAKELAATVEAVGGAEAKKHADALAAATTIEEARKHFGELSVILVPKFQEEKIEGGNAYYCSMKKLPWMQKGDRVQNPYYGKSMLTCGSPLTPKK